MDPIKNSESQITQPLKGDVPPSKGFLNAHTILIFTKDPRTDQLALLRDGKTHYLKAKAKAEGKWFARIINYFRKSEHDVEVKIHLLGNKKETVFFVQKAHLKAFTETSGINEEELNSTTQPQEFVDYLADSPAAETQLKILDFVSGLEPNQRTKFYSTFDRLSALNFVYFCQQRPLARKLLETADTPALQHALRQLFDSPKLVKSCLDHPEHATLPNEQLLKLASENPTIYSLLEHLDKVDPQSFDEMLTVIAENPKEATKLIPLFNSLVHEKASLEAFFLAYKKDKPLTFRFIEIFGTSPTRFSLITNKTPDSLSSKFLQFIQKTDFPPKVYQMLVEQRGGTLEPLLSLFGEKPKLAEKLLDLASVGGKDRALAKWVLDGLDGYYGQNSIPFFTQVASLADSTSRKWLPHLKTLYEHAFPQKPSPNVLGATIQEDYFGRGATHPSSVVEPDPIAQRILGRLETDRTSPICSQLLAAYADHIQEKNALEGDPKEAIELVLSIPNWAVPRDNKERFILACMNGGHFALLKRLVSQKEESGFWPAIFSDPDNMLSPMIVEGLANAYQLLGDSQNFHSLKNLTKDLLQHHSEPDVNEVLGNYLYLAGTHPKEFQTLLQLPIPTDSKGLMAYKNKLHKRLFSHLNKTRIYGIEHQDIVTSLSLDFSKVLLQNGFFNTGLATSLQRWVKEHAPPYSRDTVCRMLQTLQDSPRLYDLILTAPAPRQMTQSSSVAKALSSFLGTRREKLTQRSTQLAILSGLLAPTRQFFVGSCFGTSLAIQLQEEGESFIHDAIELLTRGSLSRAGRDYAAATPNSNEQFLGWYEAHPLVRIWEYTISSMAEADISDENLKILTPLLKSKLDKITKEKLTDIRLTEPLEKTLIQKMNKRMLWRFGNENRRELKTGFGGWLLYDRLSPTTPQAEWKLISSKKEYEKFMQEIIEETISELKLDLIDAGDIRLLDAYKKELCDYVKAKKNGLITEWMKRKNESLTKSFRLPWVEDGGGSTRNLLTTYYDNWSPLEKNFQGDLSFVRTKILDFLHQLPQGVKDYPRILCRTANHAFSLQLSDPRLQEMIVPETRNKWVEERLQAARQNPEFVTIATQAFEYIFSNHKGKWNDLIEQARKEHNPIKALVNAARIICADPFDPKIALLEKKLDEAFAKADPEAKPVIFADENWYHLGWMYRYSTETWEIVKVDAYSSISKTSYDFTDFTIQLAFP